jgi:hypothetical protein
LFAGTAAFAGQAVAGEKSPVGTIQSFFRTLEFENTPVTHAYSLPTHGFGEIPVVVETYSFEDGYLAISGRAKDSDGSGFFLKGTSASLYGSVVLPDRNLAFEYTTDVSGNVSVENVPVSKIQPVCDLPDEAEEIPQASSSEAAPAGPEPHIGAYPGTPVDKFQSKPGAPKVLYWDISDAPDIFTRADMWRAWQGLASGFSAYDVNVTTDSTVYKAAGVANRGVAHQVKSSGTSSCALNSFGSGRACNIYKKSTPQYQGGTLWHELGHQLGLSHDGATGIQYFPGFSKFQWAPIMGNHTAALRWSQGLWQFSKGEYSDASMKQDDFSIIGRHLQLRADDIPGTRALDLAGTKVTPERNRGQIGSNTDTDVFAFKVNGTAGRAKFRIYPTEPMLGTSLDIQATIKNATGKTVSTNNKPGNRAAEFDVPLPAGSYTLIIAGGAEGTPDDGFSNYGSVGFYAIEGEVTGGSTVDIASSPFSASSLVVAQSPDGANVTLAFPAGASVAGIDLYSMDGTALIHVSKRIEALGISALKRGNYLLKVSMNGGIVVRKIVKM